METKGAAAIGLMDLHPKSICMYVDSFNKVTPELIRLSQGKDIVVIVNNIDRPIAEIERSLSTDGRKISVTEIKVPKEKADSQTGKRAFLVRVERK